MNDQIGEVFLLKKKIFLALLMKKKITDLNLQQLTNHDFWKINYDWLFPQTQAILSQIAPVIINNRPSAVHTLDKINQDPLTKVIVNIYKTSPRSVLVSNQTKALDYSQAVPLVLMVYKKFYSVDYHSWTDMECLLEPLHTSVLNNREINLPHPRTLDWKDLKINLSAYCSLGSWESNTIGRLDRLSKHIYLQTWLWHHSKITKYSIQSLENWDHREFTLHTSDIF